MRGARIDRSCRPRNRRPPPWGRPRPQVGGREGGVVLEQGPKDVLDRRPGWPRRPGRRRRSRTGTTGCPTIASKTSSLILISSSPWDCSTRSLTIVLIRSVCVVPRTVVVGLGQVVLGQDPGPDRIVDVVVEVGDPVGVAGDLALEGRRHRHRPGVVGDPVPDLPREVEALEDLDDPHRLEVVAEAGMEAGNDLLAQVTERACGRGRGRGRSPRRGPRSAAGPGRSSGRPG